jgi:hypothetical protein
MQKMASSLADIFGGVPKDEDEDEAPRRLVAESANPAWDFVKDLAHWLEHGKTEPPRKPGLHASSLWKTCARIPLLSKQHVLSLEPIKAGQRMTFDVGSALHFWMQNDYLGPMGRLWGDWKCLRCQKVVAQGTMPEHCPECDAPWRSRDGCYNINYSESFVQDRELDYCGHCDGLLLDRTLQKKRVFEFKTISKSQYGGLHEAKAAHVIQVHAYMHTLDLQEAIVLYWDKGSQCDWSRTDGKWIAGPPHLKAYLIRFSSSLWGAMVARIKDYHRANERAQSLPVVSDKDVMQFPRVCTHAKCDLAGECDYRNFCFRLPK